MADEIPKHRGWFSDEPEDPTLTTELLLIERPVEDYYGPWRIDGALVREPGSDPEWVAGWIDSHWSAEPKQLWEYLTDKGGGNGITWEIGFLRIPSADDAPKIAAHFNERYAKEHPFGFTEPATKLAPIIHEVTEQMEEPPETDPCNAHVHVDMPFAAADPLTWRLALLALVERPGDSMGEAPNLTLEQLAQRTGISESLLQALEREGLIVHKERDGTAYYTDADAETVSQGLALLGAGLPLSELLVLAREHDHAMREVAERAVDVFIRFVRDPIRADAGSEEEAAQRLVEAFSTMLPATSKLVARHFEQVLLAVAQERIEKVSARGVGSAGPQTEDAT